MTYNYFLTGSPTYFVSPKNTFANNFQALLYDQFPNASDYYQIQEETVFASEEFFPVNVRINRAMNSVTGIKLGDDFKIIMFPDIDHATGLGYKYLFDDNYWIVTFSEIVKNLGASCLVRRCNNVLRWIDENGNYFSEPCAIDYEISRPRDSVGTVNPVLPQGYIDAYTQLNERTRLIKGNQRFLFGSKYNRICYKVFGDGIRSFLNQKTLDDESGQLLQMSMGGGYVNTDTDDIINGVADYNKLLFLLSLSASSINGNIGDTYQLFPILTLNGNPVSRPLNYLSSSSAVTVSGSGLVTLISTGSSIITASMVNNTIVSASAIVTSSSSVSSPYDVRILPASTYIFEGEKTDFTTYLYLNGSQQSNIFVFSISGSNVPIGNYSMGITGNNSFSISNIERYLDYPLIINCTSGSYIKQLSLELRGSW